METFDFSAPADLFLADRRGMRRMHVKHRRFATGAEAIRHVMESESPKARDGATIEVDETRIDALEIDRLYHGPDYPLARAQAKGAHHGSAVAPVASER